jgi:tetratricopeptide (TPR) repeat protein
MRNVIVVLALIASVAQAQTDDRIREGVALFDQGKIDAAIAKYKEVLAGNPKNVHAAYELGLAYAAKDDYAACRAALEPVAAISGSLQVQALTMLGNCLDAGGDRKKAIAAYRRGLAIAPNDPALSYELGIALQADGKLEEARELLKRDATARPGHVNGRFALARVFEADDFRSAALIEYLHFLALDPASPRAAEAIKRVRGLLDAGVTQKDQKNIEIGVDPNARTEEGDYGPFAMGVSIVSAGRFTDDGSKKGAFESLRSQIADVINIFIETTPDMQRDYTAQSHVRFFTAMSKEKLVDTFAGIIIATQKLDGATEWGKKNEAEIPRYLKWVEPYRNAKPLVEMAVQPK